MLVRGWWVFEVPLQGMLPWSRVGSPFPPAQGGWVWYACKQGLFTKTINIYCTIYMAQYDSVRGPSPYPIPFTSSQNGRDWPQAYCQRVFDAEISDFVLCRCGDLWFCLVSKRRSLILSGFDTEICGCGRNDAVLWSFALKYIASS